MAAASGPVMVPLPPTLGAAKLMGWRVDYAARAARWDSGKGAEIDGGRWNPEGFATVSCSVDPSTAILEVAVHKGFRVLDTVAHVLTGFEVHAMADVHVVWTGAIPNPGWLMPGTPGGGQQAHGMSLLQRHAFVLIPSAVASHSWNLLFNPVLAGGRYTRVVQEPLVIDTRLHPPVKTAKP